MDFVNSSQTNSGQEIWEEGDEDIDFDEIIQAAYKATHLLLKW